jgi:hypothetical protein
MGREISVGTRSEMASSEAERRLLSIFKKSARVRRIAEIALSLALAGRRATSRH